MGNTDHILIFPNTGLIRFDYFRPLQRHLYGVPLTIIYKIFELLNIFPSQEKEILKRGSRYFLAFDIRKYTPMKRNSQPLLSVESLEEYPHRLPLREMNGFYYCDPLSLDQFIHTGCARGYIPKFDFQDNYDKIALNIFDLPEVFSICWELGFEYLWCEKADIDAFAVFVLREDRRKFLPLLIDGQIMPVQVLDTFIKTQGIGKGYFNEEEFNRVKDDFSKTFAEWNEYLYKITLMANKCLRDLSDYN